MLLPEVSKIAVRDVELTRPLGDIVGLDGYVWSLLLVRFRGVPVDYLTAPVEAGVVRGSTIRELVARNCRKTLPRLMMENLLSQPIAPDASLADLHAARPFDFPGPWPRVSVCVCTRDRPLDLKRCLDSLLALDYPDLELLVIDNAPTTPESEQLVTRDYPTVRYVREPRPGLDWARNRAVHEASGELIAYADDDVVVESGWVRALAAAFMEDPAVMAVTGLVLPYELETEAQIRFELQHGFGRGFQRLYAGINLPLGELASTRFAGIGLYGTGANMAYRRSVFDKIGLFDPALDVGTITNGGGDLEMFFRVIKGGYALAYEPTAAVRHRHRPGYAKLFEQIANDGVGYYSFLARCFVHFPEERAGLLRAGLWWLLYWSTQRMVVNQLRGHHVVRDLARVEFAGSFRGMTRYSRSRRKALALAGTHEYHGDRLGDSKQVDAARAASVAVRSVDIGTLTPIEDVLEYPKTLVFVEFAGQVIGSVEIANLYDVISLRQLRTRVAQWLWLPILERLTGLRGEAAVDVLMASVLDRGAVRAPHRALAAAPASPTLSVSVVVNALERPEDLRLCLRSLLSQRTQRAVEIVVVNNHPDSAATQRVVQAFPNVKLVNESRRGAAYARNCGIAHSTGDVVVTTDDDVIAAPDWLERLLSPFSRPEVSVVTGAMLPAELETVSQQLFERQRHPRLHSAFEVDHAWFSREGRAAPTWTLGATTNAAFRAQLFREPNVGLLSEALGPGTPAGDGEDSYLFYRILKAGHVMVHEPAAIVWQRHGRKMAALRRRVFDAAKGHVAYQLHTVLCDRDLRALRHLIGTLAPFRVRQLLRILRNELRGTNEEPLLLAMIQLAGNVAGPVELLRSYGRVLRLGRSVVLSKRAAAEASSDPDRSDRR